MNDDNLKFTLVIIKYRNDIQNETQICQLEHNFNAVKSSGF